jgi:uncharacterized delta-60 repeat protein
MHIGIQDRATALAIQPDGKIVVSSATNGVIGVARFNIDGSLDNSFANNGKDTFHVSVFCRGNVIAVQADGKILVAGDDLNAGSDFALVRLMSDGSLDYSFNSNGLVITDIQNLNNYCNAIATDVNGKIILAGHSGAVATVVRYNNDGSLDNSFNDSGKIHHAFSAGTSHTDAYAVITQADGTILVAGAADPPANTSYDFVLFKLKNNGRRDSSFGVNGASILDFAGNYDKCNGAVLLPNGKIILAGYTVSASTGNDFAMARFNADGTLDSSFGNDGKVVTDLGGGEVARGITIQSDSRIVLTGSFDNQFVLARYNPDGDIDKTFGIDGAVKTIINGIDDRSEDVAIQPNGKIVVTGYAEYPPTPQWNVRKVVLAQYHGNWASSVVDAQEPSFSIYPNPATEVLYLQNNSTEKVALIKLINVNGKVVKEYAEPHQTLDIRDMPAGFYFLWLYSEQRQAVKPIVIYK